MTPSSSTTTLALRHSASTVICPTRGVHLGHRYAARLAERQERLLQRASGPRRARGRWRRSATRSPRTPRTFRAQGLLRRHPCSADPGTPPPRAPDAHVGARRRSRSPAGSPQPMSLAFSGARHAALIPPFMDIGTPSSESCSPAMPTRCGPGVWSSSPHQQAAVAWLSIAPGLVYSSAADSRAPSGLSARWLVPHTHRASTR